MVKVLHIRRIPPCFYDGTDTYCRALHECLANDRECMVLDVPDIPQLASIFNYKYDEDVLKTYISKADVIHINGYTALGTRQALKLSKQMGKKVVYTAHWHPFSKLRRPLLGKLFFILMLKPYIKRYADVVTTINNEDTAFFKSFHKNVVQIPHWILRTSRPVSATTRKPNMILFVGRLNDPVKGFHHILSLPENVYDIHCVGSGQLDTCRKDITHHVNLTPEELDKLYAEASLVVIPSKYEAFSYATLEAMSKGTPVLMSEHVRIADYLNNVEGYSIFHYGDTEEFNAKVKENIGRSVDVDYVTTTFGAEQIISKYKTIYTSI